ncbi:MAG: hypothetical protein S4CHLAM81_08140 [Chlamydiales bacterium]|nr:hypothetical protein [Chlamydiales bacterium]MCH9635596.1 hypothetical protein [Chlamydiales bacterium]
MAAEVNPAVARSASCCVSIVIAAEITMLVCGILALQGKLNIPPAGAGVMVFLGSSAFLELILACSSCSSALGNQ